MIGIHVLAHRIKFEDFYNPIINIPTFMLNISSS